MNDKQTQQKTKQDTGTRQLPPVRMGVVVLLLLAVAVFVSRNREVGDALPTPSIVAAATTQPLATVAPAETVVVEQMPTPGFLSLGDEGIVTLSAEDIETIRVEIVRNVSLQPFLHGLTEDQVEDTVNGYIAGFNRTLVRGSASNNNLQRQLLYRYGSYLTASRDAGSAEAQAAIDGYVQGFQDDLRWIGPANAEAPGIVLAIVALDALGEQELAEEYVRDVFNARAANERAALLKDLAQSGLDSSRLSEPVRETVEQNQPEPVQESQAVQPTAVPQPPVAEAVPPLQPLPQPAAPEAILLPLDQTQGGFAISPYNWVLSVQQIGRLFNGNPQEDHFFFEGFETTDFTFLGRSLYYSKMFVRRDYGDGQTRTFTIILIAGDRPTDIPLGQEIKYDTLYDMVANSLSFTN